MIAWESRVVVGSPGVWDLRIGTVTSSGLTNVHRMLDDINVNTKPAFSADSKTIFFHRAVVGSGRGFEIWAISPDGTGLRELTGLQPGQSEYPAT
jgi:hypothetical protein